MRYAVKTILLFAATLSSLCNTAQAEGPVKVFILAGQSNMVGHGRVEIGHGETSPGSGGIGSLRYQVNNDPANYGHLVDGSGNWITRNDVWVWSTGDGGEKGNLTVGFGAADFNIGPEFGFGHEIADLFDEQVLLIKTAWGGKSLGADFRPPSAVAKRGGTVGFYYNEILNVYNNVINNIATEFPAYNGQGVELVGMGWHQGWNDRFNTAFANEYEPNMADFINDIRDSLNAPNLPFVIAETGHGGYSETNPNALAIMAAQAAVADPAKYPEFAGNVAFVETKGFWRDISVSPTTAGHHWNANGESYYLIGHGMGNAMASLIPEPSTLILATLALLGVTGRRRRRIV
jgi:hypothetical protein